MWVCFVIFLRMEHNQGHERDFLTVGSMGHAASIALGIALKKPNRQVRKACSVFLRERERGREGGKFSLHA